MSNPQPSVIVRTYKGDQARATAWFQQDAANLARTGYFPSSQTYAPGAWGCGGFLIALLLCVILIGFIVFIYMLIVKPDGTLTVTYEYRGTAPPAAAEKTCPKCAETVKAAAAVCRFCGHQFEPASIVAAPQPTDGLRRAPATSPLDPFALARAGGTQLHDKLVTLPDTALQAIIRDCGLDPTGYYTRWRRDDLIRLIENEATKEVRSEHRT